MLIDVEFPLVESDKGFIVIGAYIKDDTYNYLLFDKRSFANKMSKFNSEEFNKEWIFDLLSNSEFKVLIDIKKCNEYIKYSLCLPWKRLNEKYYFDNYYEIDFSIVNEFIRPYLLFL